MNFLRKIVVNALKTTLARYHQGARLTRSKAPDDPLQLFADWFTLAREIDPEWGTAVTLSTATREGVPSNRLVLLKDFNKDGFVFYTNYNSRKARELDENPHAALVFWWKETCRQLRVEGVVERVDEKTSDAYFASRPRGSKLGAWASRQSAPLARRMDLEQAVQEFERKYKETPVPRPPFWGGYRLRPTVIEFWQGRLDRLHDRLRYTKKEDQTWEIERLYP